MILGIDGGNHKVKVVGPNGAVDFYSNIGEARERRLESEFGSDDMTVEYDGRTMFAGSLAKFECEFGSTMMGSTKNHPDGKMRILLAMFRYSPESVYALVVGQPICQHTAAEKQAIKDMLLGRHRIAVNGQERLLVVQRVEVAAGPSAALWAAPKKGLRRVIDPGSGTTNCGTLIDMKKIDKESFTIPFGVDSTISKDLSAMAEGIARYTSKTWHRDDPVEVIGGKALEILPYIQEHYPRAVVFRPVIYIGGQAQELHPVYANAAGFYAIARRLYNG